MPVLKKLAKIGAKKRNSVLYPSSSIIVEDEDNKFIPNPGAQAASWKFLTASSPGIDALWLRAGLNSGKSTVGSAFCCWRSLVDPNGRGLITANSYSQLATSTLVALVSFCGKFGVKIYPRAKTVELTAEAIARRRYCYLKPLGSKHWTFHYVLSAENFTSRTENSQETGRGLEVRWAWADEYTYAKRSALETISGRVGRGPGKSEGLIFISSSINRNNPYNWAYSLFDDPINQSDRYVSIAGSTLENPYASQAYLDRMRQVLTDELFQIEIESEYAVSSVGKIYKYFKRSQHLLNTLLLYDSRFPLHLSFDFNHSPACAIAAQWINEELIVLKEWYLLDSNTFELVDSVVAWLGEIGYKDHYYNRLQIHGDATGNQKTANSKRTNWQIVKDGIKNYYYEQCYKKVNPEVKDSINALNMAFKSSQVFLNYSCQELAKDLETLSRDKDGNIDKRDGLRSHLQDCLRYLCWDLMPYKPQDIKKAFLGGRPRGCAF